MKTRVKRGLLWVRSQDPAWWIKIKKLLDLRDGDNCILGQTDLWSKFPDECSLDSYEDHGFFSYDKDEYPELTKLWAQHTRNAKVKVGISLISLVAYLYVFVSIW